MLHLLIICIILYNIIKYPLAQAQFTTKQSTNLVVLLENSIICT